MSIQTLQRLYDISRKHIREQGEGSFIIANDGEGYDYAMCLYRSPEGLSCGAAPFILQYDPDFEKKSWRTLVEEVEPEALDKDAADHWSFVMRLQQAHDESARKAVELHVDFLETYERAIEQIANEFGLEY